MNINYQNEDDIREILKQVKKIAVVGLSPKINRPSYRVAKAMQEFSYEIIPVRPAVKSILNEKVYRTLHDIPFQVDLVNVFRAPKFVPDIIQASIDLKIPVVWLQEGIVHEAAAQNAAKEGIKVIMDRCIYKDYLRLQPHAND